MCTFEQIARCVDEHLVGEKLEKKRCQEGVKEDFTCSSSSIGTLLWILKLMKSKFLTLIPASPSQSVSTECNAVRPHLRQDLIEGFQNKLHKAALGVTGGSLLGELSPERERERGK